MSKSIKTVQWNIGGGKVRRPESDIRLLASYNIDGLESIVAFLKESQPDIITLQEIHSDDRQNQVEIIAKAVGLPYFVSDFYADSHIEAGQRLGQGIISRFPITNHDYSQFQNPLYEVVWEDGSKAISHDKGVTTCRIDTGQSSLVVKTLHLVPFRRFKIDPLSDAAEKVIGDVQLKVRDSASNLLIQGDFNLDFETLREFLPRLMNGNMQEVEQVEPTTPKGRKLDHILFRGLTLTNTKVTSSVLTDHYPIVTTFDI